MGGGRNGCGVHYDQGITGYLAMEKGLNSLGLFFHCSSCPLIRLLKLFTQFDSVFILNYLIFCIYKLKPLDLTPFLVHIFTLQNRILFIVQAYIIIYMQLYCKESPEIKDSCENKQFLRISVGIIYILFVQKTMVYKF